MFIDFLGALLLPHFDAGGSGGSGGTGSTDDNKGNDNDDKNKEETITLTKAEYEAKLNQKFAEGARKAQGGTENNKSQVDPKANTEQNKGGNSNDFTKELDSVKSELELLRGEKLALNQGIKPDYTEDAVAILKGKGLEVNEANMKSIIDKHPEWKLSSDGDNSGVAKPLGSTGGKTNPPQPDEATQAAKMFGL